MSVKYELKVHLIQGTDLIAADSGGTSDPYVKLKTSYSEMRSKTISKTLNPKWDQHFTMQIHGIEDTLQFHVFEITVHYVQSKRVLRLCLNVSFWFLFFKPHNFQ